jgi:hypothetical protein
MFPVFDLIRLLLAFAVLFAIVPYLVFRRNLVRGFVQAVFFLQLAAMVLGDWKLYLPGSAGALYVVWCAAAAFLIRRREALDWGVAGARLLQWVESRQAVRLPHLSVPPAWAAVVVIAAAVGLRASWFALHNVRLLRLESYSRAISLHTLMRGELWDHDPGVALLAPLAWLSGLAPDQVIRFSGALVSAALILAMAFAGWRRIGTLTGTVGAAAVFALSLIGLNLVPSEPGGAEWSAIFVILAFGLAGEAWGLAALSLVTGALICLGLSPVLLLAALALTVASLLPQAAGRVPAFAALAVLAVAMLMPPRGAAPEHQYEAAARVAHRIAREFRTNDWIVVSPGLEVAQTYGRGWHVELADFVNSHSENQVAQPGFQFPYSAQSMFVFVEKRVLNQPAFSFVRDAGAAPYYYHTQLGRASLEFRAARLMASYVGTHRDAEVFYEDDDLIVYKLAAGGA